MEISKNYEEKRKISSGGYKENNIIICEFDIKEYELNKPIQILNYLNEKLKNEIEDYAKEIGIDMKLETNKDEINELYCDLYLNDKKIEFFL